MDMLKSRMEDGIEEIIGKLTLDEKISLCHGCDSMSAGEVKRLGIGRMTMADGPQGVRLEDGRTATALPCGISLACSFDIEAAQEYGRLLARECLANGIQAILGPGFNLMRTPLNGRNFEYFGEDPVLAGEIAAAYIKGAQSLGVAACPKHIALNNQEKCRTVTDAIIEERPLRELYLRAFEISTRKGNPWMMMSALNLVNGIRCAHSKLLQQDIAKEEFGFDGVMVSDWGAAKDTKAAALGGLDLDMGHGDKPVLGGEALKKLVESGEVPLSVIDDKVRRMLRLLFRMKILGGGKPERGECNTPGHQKLAERFAVDGMVLLKNNDNLLPLNRSALRKIAVIGPNAAKAHSLGSLLNCGGSGATHPPHEITPLEGLKTLLGDSIEVAYEPGVLFECDALIRPEILRTPTGEQGLLGEYFDKGAAKPFMTRIDRSFDLQWGNLFAAGKELGELDGKLFDIRWTGFLVPDHSGPVKLVVNGARTRARVYIDGVEVIAQKHKFWWRQFYESHSFEAVAGHRYEIRIEMERLLTEFTEFQLLWVQDPTEGIERAVKLAAASDLVLYFGGTNHRLDREAVGGDFVPDADIPSLTLPALQDELINKLLDVNKKTVVSLVNGSVVEVEKWVDRVPALLECWYAGMEAGHAIAKVLFGEAAPGGRLCFTWGRRLEDYACHANGNYPGHCGEDHPNVRYDEGIFIGYRHFDRAKIEPRFPFGFGLSCTSFKRSLAAVRQEGDGIVAIVEVENSGRHPGYDVVQLYVRDVKASSERPEKELQAFGKIFLKPGERGAVELRLAPRDFAFYDERTHRFAVEPGEFELLFGSSSRDIFAKHIISR